MKQTTGVCCSYVRPAPTITHLVNLPIEANFVYHVGSLLQKSGSLANGTNKSRRISLNVQACSLLLSAILFTVGRHSPTLQCRLELLVDHQTVADWSWLRGSLLGRPGVGQTRRAPVAERSTKILLAIIKASSWLDCILQFSSFQDEFIIQSDLCG